MWGCTPSRKMGTSAAVMSRWSRTYARSHGSGPGGGLRVGPVRHRGSGPGATGAATATRSGKRAWYIAPRRVCSTTACPSSTGVNSRHPNPSCCPGLGRCPSRSTPCRPRSGDVSARPHRVARPGGGGQGLAESARNALPVSSAAHGGAAARPERRRAGGRAFRPPRRRRTRAAAAGRDGDGTGGKRWLLNAPVRPRSRVIGSRPPATERSAVLAPAVEPSIRRVDRQWTASSRAR